MKKKYLFIETIQITPMDAKVFYSVTPLKAERKKKGEHCALLHIKYLQ